MKKLIFILIFCLSTIACAQIIVKNVFQKTYIAAQYNIAHQDVYKQLKIYGADSIPLNKWLTNQMISDTTVIIQRIIREDVDKKTNYQFIFTEYKSLKDSSFQFVVRYTGKNK